MKVNNMNVVFLVVEGCVETGNFYSYRFSGNKSVEEIFEIIRENREDLCNSLDDAHIWHKEGTIAAVNKKELVKCCTRIVKEEKIAFERDRKNWLKKERRQI